MIKLDAAPLNAEFDGAANTLFLDGKKLAPAVRTLEQMTPVLYGCESCASADESMPLYFMYRGLAGKNGFRYDLTVVPAIALGKECNKTFGHYHAKANGHTFAEVYEVLYGEALYLLQKKDLSDVVLVKAKKGDKVFVPPDYGHVTINASKKSVVAANWTTEKESDYRLFKEKKGAAYYVLTGGKFVKNKAYGQLPELRIVDASEQEFNPFDGKENVCRMVLEKPSLLDFLR